MFKVPDHQVAGHKAVVGGQLGPLVNDSGRFYKPLQSDERGANEVAFYKSFASNSKIPDHVGKFFPKFYGTELIDASDGSGKKSYLILEDLNFDRVNPTIMDIKMGSRTWAPRATEEYIVKCLKKDKESSSVELGFRLCGLQIFENKESGFYKPENKFVIQSLAADEVKLVLKKFVSTNENGAKNSKPDCAFASVVYGGSSGILSQLLELKAWFEDQTAYHFCSCSILIMFQKELVLSGKSPRAEIKLIDFAHVFEGNGVIDHNFLGGLCSLIKFISEILTAPDDCAPDSLLEGDQTNHVPCNNVDLD